MMASRIRITIIRTQGRSATGRMNFALEILVGPRSLSSVSLFGVTVIPADGFVT